MACCTAVKLCHGYAVKLTLGMHISRHPGSRTQSATPASSAANGNNLEVSTALTTTARLCWCWIPPNRPAQEGQGVVALQNSWGSCSGWGTRRPSCPCSLHADSAVTGHVSTLSHQGTSAGVLTKHACCAWAAAQTLCGGAG